MTQQNPASPDGEMVLVPRQALEAAVTSLYDLGIIFKGDTNHNFKHFYELETALASAPRPDGEWVTLECTRVLYVDRGKTTILCDRLPSPVTLVLQLASSRPDAGAKLAEIQKRYQENMAMMQRSSQLLWPIPYLLDDIAALLSFTERAASLEKAHHERGIRIIGLSEHAGAHLCRAEKAEATASEALQECGRLRVQLAEAQAKAIEECVKKILHRAYKDRQCEKLSGMDPETGAYECSIEVRGGNCLCNERNEEVEEIVAELRALSPTTPAQGADTLSNPKPEE